MKRTITVVLALFISVSAWAQSIITIDVTNVAAYSSLTGRDVVCGLKLGSSVLPSFAPANTATWDLTNVVYDSTLTKANVRLAALTPYKYGDSVQRNFGMLSFLEQQWNLFAYQGIITYESVLDTQTLYIPRTSPKVPDTFTITSQKNPLSSGGYKKLSFPMTYGTAWSNNCTFSNFLIFNDTTAGVDTLVKANAKVFYHITSYDTVCGWGKMRIKRPTGDTTAYYNVLQLRSAKVEKDSFYLNGAPFPPYLLTFLGITQGQTTKTYKESFYRKGRITPFAKFTFSDSTYTTITGSEIDTNATAPGTGVENIDAVYNDIKVYPNPVVNHKFTIEVPAGIKGNWSYDLISITGQTVAAATLSLDAYQNHQQITLPNSLVPGVYYLRITNDGEVVNIKALTIGK